MSETMTETPAAPPEAPASAAPPPASVDLLDAVGETPKPGPDGKPARPDWCPEQFWDAERGEARAEAMARSWQEFRAKVSRGEHKAPADATGYALPKVEGLPEGAIPADDPIWTGVREAAHQAGLSQAQLEAVAKPYLEAVRAAMAEADPAVQAQAREAELAKLGPEGKAVAREVRSWLEGMHSRGVLSEAEFRVLKQIGGGSAEGVRALAKLRAKAGECGMPVEALDAGGMSMTDAQAMMVEGFKRNDQAMVAKARQALEQMQAQGMLR